MCKSFSFSIEGQEYRTIRSETIMSRNFTRTNGRIGERPQGPRWPTGRGPPGETRSPGAARNPGWGPLWAADDVMGCCRWTWAPGSTRRKRIYWTSGDAGTTWSHGAKGWAVTRILRIGCYVIPIGEAGERGNRGSPGYGIEGPHGPVGMRGEPWRLATSNFPVYFIHCLKQNLFAPQFGQ